MVESGILGVDAVDSVLGGKNYGIAVTEEGTSAVAMGGLFLLR